MCPHWNAVLEAELLQESRAADAQVGLQGAGLIIEARVNDSAVAAAGMRCEFRLLLQDDDARFRMAHGGGPGDRQTGDSAADHENINRTIAQ